MAHLEALVDATSVPCADAPWVALVAGEAGIGKTRLLRELLAAVRSDDLTILAGGAEPDGLDRPYSTLASVLGERLGDDHPDSWTGVFLERLSKGRGLLIVEDLHWADGQSVAVIDALSRAQLPQFLIIGSYRPDDLSRRLPGGELLGRLERRHNVERVRLEPLTRAEVGAMLVGMLDGPPTSAVIEALHHRSGGNPFVLEELVTSCCSGGPEELVAAELPWSLDDVVRSRLEGLGPRERRVVEAMAICGSASSFDVLADVAELAESDLIDALRLLVSSGMVEESTDDQFDFHHALMRDAVGAQLLGRQRRRLHERALEALTQRRPDDLAGRARLAAGAGRFEELVELARSGVRSYLDRGSTFVALRLADLALQEEPDDPVLLAAATEAAWLVGLEHEALGYVQRWVRSVPTGSAERLDPVRWWLRLLYELGDEETFDAVRPELEELVSALSPGHADFPRGAAALAQLHMLRAEVDDAVAWADRAEAAAVTLGDHESAIQARVERGSARMQVHGEAARPELEAAVRQAEEAHLWVLVTRGINNLFELTPVYAPGGAELLTRFRRAAEQAGFDAVTASWTGFREVDAAIGQADLGLARRELEHISEWARLQPRGRDWHRQLDTLLLIEEGRLSQAEATLAERRADHPTTHSLAGDRSLRLALAGHRRNAAEAEQLLQAQATEPLGGDRSSLTMALADFYSARDAGVDAAVVAATALGWIEHHPDGAVVAQVARALLAADHDPARGIEVVGGALEGGNLVLPRTWGGTLYTELAQMYASGGDRASALVQLDLADEALRRWPGWRRDRAAALRRRLDARGAPAADGELTAREKEVAVLLAEGLTNGQVATRLYISPKTAAVHVSNILMKLQMSSRTEVAAWAVRSGLAPDPEPV